MNGKERYTKILRHEKPDRIGLYEHFWGDTHKTWIEQGHIREGENLCDHFGYDLQEGGGINFTADLDFEPVVVAEDEDTITILDGNGARLRKHKKHDATPEHVGFEVIDRYGWEEKIKPLLTKVDEGRIDFENYRTAKAAAEKAGRFFLFSSVNVFELMHPVCGHEHMLAGMALDPEWIIDMVKTYSELIVWGQKTLFEREGYPDGIYFYEDMGFKDRPFMSYEMYRDLIQPAHKYTFDYAHSVGLPVTMHSCGFIEPLLPGMIEAGLDCLDVIEVKAGMDLVKLHQMYSERIAFMGGIDVRALYSNDKAIIDAELEKKIPLVKQGFNYVLHSDHSIPKTVNYETYQYFIKKGLELGTYD